MSIQQNFLTTILSEDSEQELQQKNQIFKQLFKETRTFSEPKHIF